MYPVGGLQLINTQYARLGEVIGQYDLGLSIVMGAHQVVTHKFSLTSRLHLSLNFLDKINVNNCVNV